MQHRFLHRRALLTLAALAAVLGPVRLAGAAPSAIDWRQAPLRLLMVQKRGCAFCAAWDREIAPGYAASAEGRSAPLLRVDIDGPWPDGLALASRPFATPTFVLLQEGIEIGRIQGYPGAARFHPQLAAMLERAGREVGR